MRGGTRAGLVLLPFLCRPPRAPISLCAVPPQPAPPQLLVPSSQPLLDLPPLQTERQGHQGGRSVKQHKVRQHVNPLRTSHQTLLDLDDGWTASAFADPTRHLHVDIGCARGLWCLDLAQRRPDWNVLGLEIRQVLADAAQEDASALQLRNLRFFPCNANVNLDAMLAKAEAAGTILNSASLQFPDPWFKVRVPPHRAAPRRPPLRGTDGCGWHVLFLAASPSHPRPRPRAPDAAIPPPLPVLPPRPSTTSARRPPPPLYLS